VLVLQEKRVREIMEAMGLKFKDLAVNLEISPSHCSHILRGRRQATLDLAKKLSAIFGADTFSHLIAWQELKLTALQVMDLQDKMRGMGLIR